MSAPENCFYFNKYEEKILINKTEAEIINEYNKFLDTFQKPTKESYLKLKHIDKININSSTFYTPFNSDVLICTKTIKEQQLHAYNVKGYTPSSNRVDPKLDRYWKINSSKEICYSIIIVCTNNNNLFDARIILFTSRDIILDINIYDYGRNLYKSKTIEVKASINKDVLYSQIHENELKSIIEAKKQRIEKLIKQMTTLDDNKIEDRQDYLEIYLTEFIKIHIEFYQNKIFFVLFISVTGEKNIILTFNYLTEVNNSLSDCIKYIFEAGIKNLSVYMKYNKTNNKYLSDLILKLLAYKNNINKETNLCKQAING
jgi:hypothetical protein